MCDKKEDNKSTGSSGLGLLGIIGSLALGAAAVAGIYYATREEPPQRTEYTFPTDRNYHRPGVSAIKDCAICNESLDHSMSVLPCRHTFHKKCVDERVKATKIKACPICKKSF